MAQNIYDNPTFFSRYRALSRQVLGLDGAPEWPSIEALMPDLQGKAALDLGCGFGWVCRWMRAKGADMVLGIDLSENMLERARAATDDDNVKYQRGDIEKISLPASAFDIIFSSLAFHYISDFAKLMKVIKNALVSNGVLLFSIEHPIYMSSKNPRWIKEKNGSLFWTVSHYSEEGPRWTNWLAADVIKYHRSIATTVNDIIESGLNIDKIIEFFPSDSQVQINPELLIERERPMFLVVRASLR